MAKFRMFESRLAFIGYKVIGYRLTFISVLKVIHETNVINNAVLFESRKIGRRRKSVLFQVRIEPYPLWLIFQDYYHIYCTVMSSI